ncbi:unnamed protein product [Urochloa decumbens]|uniref:F-box domain-containing protein n=1 Tax=Urochloa decumbens TaxID=240449 RepID=A0ABC9G544_9POAL
MEFRSDPRRRRVAGPCGPGGAGGGVDRISGLPDDLLLHVLARLRCARAAAHASLLSRRWRGLWRYLPELTFREIAPGALDAALAQVARTELPLSLLDIDVPPGHRLSPARVASLLRAAARAAPAELSFVVWGLPEDRPTAVEVPRFHRATSVKFAMWNLAITLPDEAEGGGFPVAEKLSIDGCIFDFGALISRCPRLRLLQARCIDGIGTITVHSPTIESLDVDGVSLRGVDIVAPLLKKFTLMGSYTRRDLSVSFSAPMVQDVHWSAHFSTWWVLTGSMWGLCRFSLCLEEGAYRLHLRIEAQDFWLTGDVNLKQKIAQFPCFSVLKLSLVTCGHIYGATALNVLEVCTDIKRLTLVIYDLKVRKPCMQNCRCDQPYNWRNQNISLAALEEVEIEGFEGAEHEVDLLKLILKCAPMLKAMTVTLSDEVSPCISGCEEICRVLKACPSLKWSVYSLH